MSKEYPYEIYILNLEEYRIDRLVMKDDEDESQFNQYMWDEDPKPMILGKPEMKLVLSYGNDNQECHACGIILGWDELLSHDEVECLGHMEMIRKYYNIV